MNRYANIRIITVPQYGVIPDVKVEDLPASRLGKLLGKYIAFTSRNRMDSLSATGNVGVVQLGQGLLLNIVPRFRTRNLTYMVNACSGSWVNVIEGMDRNYVVGRSASDWIQEILKIQYVKRCEELRMTGLMRGYRRRSIITSSPFGRIEVGKSLSLRAKGVFDRLECSYEERTVDIPVNSCLLLALEKSAIVDRPIHEKNRKRIIELFDGVHMRPRRECLSDEYFEGRAVLPENWKAYRELLDMAWLIVDGGALQLESLPMKGKRLPSLCIDFQHLFEEYVRKEMRDRLKEEFEVLDGNSSAGKVPLYRNPTETLVENVRSLTAPGTITADCDILIKGRRDGRVLMAAECKCTSLDSYGIAQRSEIEQAVVYAVRFDLPFALVIHPVIEPAASGLETPGTIGNVAVYQYNINIDADDMGMETDHMACTLKHLLNVGIKHGLKVDADSI